MGLFAGVMSALWMILEIIMLVFWDWLDPEETIEKAINFDHARYMADKESFGDHTFKVSQAKTEPVSKEPPLTTSPYYTTYF